MENANREREILEVTFKERNEKERKIRDNSKKRGEKAYRKEKGLSQLKSFEQEIEKLTIFENKAKVQEDAKISVPM